MGKNSKHARKKNQQNNRQKKIERRKILALPAPTAKPLPAVLPGLPAPAIPRPRNVFVFNRISTTVRRQLLPINPRLPVRTREGMPAVVVSIDPRIRELPLLASALRGPASYIGRYTLYGEYTPRRDSNPLDLFNCSLAEWHDMMGKNWDLSEDAKLLYPQDFNDEIPVL